MYNEEYNATAAGAAAKVGLLKKNPLGYFLLSALAGAYIGFGILLSFTVSGTLGAIPMTKIAMGLSFGIALSLVIIAGAELFTGNAFVLFNGWRSHTVTMSDVVRLWIVCYLGNWAGAIILSLIFYAAAGTAGGVGTALANAAAMKMSLPPLVLFAKGILCNVLVCLAVWCGFRTKNDAAKLIMVFWCLYAFFTCGFEHSVANMTVLTLGMLNPAGAAVSFGGYLYNLAFVTVGNIVGAVVFLSIPYGIGALKK
ncbi:formate/nitrite transporter family protein [Megasphaera sp.]|uniref:formate/nitrite transporter family protein n=1 Tax=Megasphaera sp. TaxID=2023260 RepID=UPI0025F06E35|nr:formate/nitrite transporter family protein [uncultured Megasphaera sp.]